MNDTPQQDPTKLFVGNLPWSMKDEDLRDIFSKYGELEDVHLVTDRYSGRSRGIAFIKFGGDDAVDNAQAAIEGEDGQEYEGRPLRVNIAEPRKPRSNRGGYNRGGRGGDRGGYNRRDNDRY
jgi:cold-inducible RNA-binding protein